jgi:hypothetical protein
MKNAPHAGAGCMQGKLYVYTWKRLQGGGRLRSDGSTGPPERLCNIDHRHQKKRTPGAEAIPERRGPEPARSGQAASAAQRSCPVEHPKRHPGSGACRGYGPSIGALCGPQGDSPWGGHRTAPGNRSLQFFRSSGSTSIISATQSHLRSPRITSSANQPDGGRSRYSIAVMVYLWLGLEPGRKFELPLGLLSW